jgi:hypothetical protein
LLIATVHIQRSDIAIYKNFTLCHTTMPPGLHIPPNFKDQILPKHDLSILEFLKFDLPPFKPTTPFTNPDQYFTPDMPNTTDLEEIRLLLTPPSSVIKALSEALQIDTSAAKSVKCPHISTINEQRFPLWIVQYWAELVKIREIRQKWVNAEMSLAWQTHPQKGVAAPHTALIRKVYDGLSCIAWAGTIRGFSASIGTHYLATYATRDWLTDEHESQMLDLLRYDVLREGSGEHAEIESIFFLSKLQDAYRDQENYGTHIRHRWIRGQGQALSTGTREQLVILANIGDNHWIALILDFKLSIIWYGDSLGKVISDELHDVMEWWTHLHTGRTFDHAQLGITRQRDGFSCGLLAWNALAVYLLKDQYSLINTADVAEERLKILLRVIS